MKPHPLTEDESLNLLMMGSIKAWFRSPAEKVREKFDLVKLLVRHIVSTFFFKVDGVTTVSTDNASLNTNEADIWSREHRSPRYPSFSTLRIQSLGKDE